MKGNDWLGPKSLISQDTRLSVVKDEGRSIHYVAFLKLCSWSYWQSLVILKISVLTSDVWNLPCRQFQVTELWNLNKKLFSISSCKIWNECIAVYWHFSYWPLVLKNWLILSSSHLVLRKEHCVFTMQKVQSAHHRQNWDHGFRYIRGKVDHLLVCVFSLTA